MSTYKKKIAAVVATALIPISLCSCMEKKQNEASSKTYGDYPISGGETLTFWSSLNSNVSATATNLGDTEFAKELEKRTGIKINYIHPAAGQESESFSLMLASSDLPDMIQYNWQGALGGPSGMIADGVIIPLNDTIEKNAVNLKKYLSEHPDIDRVIKTDDGDYYIFPFIRGDKKLLISTGPIFRKDWLDELGLSVPQTIDEWENALKLFRDQKKAQAPLSISPTTKNFIYFIMNATPDFYIKDGQVKLGCIEPEFKEALITLNRWFKEGLLDKNFTSADASMNTYNILNGDSGATFGGGGADMGKWLDTMADKDDKFDLVGVQYPKDKNGNDCAFVPFNDFYAPHASVAITTNCKDPGLAAKWLDYGYSEEGHMLNNFGIENVSYKLVDGYPKYTDIITNNPDGLTLGQAMARYMRSCYSSAFVQDKRYIEQYYGKPQQKAALDAWLTCYDASMKVKMPQVTISPDESSDYANIYNEIIKYRDEKVAAFISGTESLDNYDEYLETMKKLKVDEAIKIQQNAYNRFMKR